MFFGFAGQGFKNEADVNLTPGQSVTVGAFTVRHDALRVTADAQKQMITGHVTVFEDGREIGTLEPAKWFFEKRVNEPTTEVAIRRAVGEDLYVVLAGFEVAEQSDFYKVTVNPLVNWVWLGLGHHGDRVHHRACCPSRCSPWRWRGCPRERRRRRSWCLLLLSPGHLHAQAPAASSNVSPPARARSTHRSKGRSCAPAGAAVR